MSKRNRDRGTQRATENTAETNAAETNTVETGTENTGAVETGTELDADAERNMTMEAIMARNAERNAARAAEQAGEPTLESDVNTETQDTIGLESDAGENAEGAILVVGEADVAATGENVADAGETVAGTEAGETGTENPGTENPGTEPPVEGEAVAEEAPARKGTIVPDRFKKQYKLNGGNCGDEMAAVMGDLVKTANGTDMVKLREIGHQNNVDVETRWGHLNVGQKRMNLSNVLRARIKNGQPVTVGTMSWNAAPGDADAEKAVA